MEVSLSVSYLFLNHLVGVFICCLLGLLFLPLLFVEGLLLFVQLVLHLVQSLICKLFFLSNPLDLRFQRFYCLFKLNLVILDCFLGLLLALDVFVELLDKHRELFILRLDLLVLVAFVFLNFLLNTFLQISNFGIFELSFVF